MTSNFDAGRKGVHDAYVDPNQRLQLVDGINQFKNSKESDIQVRLMPFVLAISKEDEVKKQAVQAYFMNKFEKKGEPSLIKFFDKIENQNYKTQEEKDALRIKFNDEVVRVDTSYIIPGNNAPQEVENPNTLITPATPSNTDAGPNSPKNSGANSAPVEKKSEKLSDPKTETPPSTDSSTASELTEATSPTPSEPSKITANVSTPETAETTTSSETLPVTIPQEQKPTVVITTTPSTTNSDIKETSPNTPKVSSELNASTTPSQTATTNPTETPTTPSSAPAPIVTPTAPETATITAPQTSQATAPNVSIPTTAPGLQIPTAQQTSPTVSVPTNSTKKNEHVQLTPKQLEDNAKEMGLPVAELKILMGDTSSLILPSEEEQFKLALELSKKSAPPVEDDMAKALRISQEEENKRIEARKKEENDIKTVENLSRQTTTEKTPPLPKKTKKSAIRVVFEFFTSPFVKFFNFTFGRFGSWVKSFFKKPAVTSEPTQKT